MRRSLLLPIFAVIVVAGSPVFAQAGPTGGDCESDPAGCGNQNPPPPPSLPPSSGTIGSYRVYVAGGTRDGFIVGDQTLFQSTYFGGGGYRDVGSDTLTVGGAGSQATLKPTYLPEASAYAAASSDGINSAQGDIGVTYLVELHAANAAAYAALTPLLGTSGAIASISGHYTLGATGQAFSIASAITGLNISLDQSLERSAGSICDYSGYFSTTGSGCGTSNYMIDLNFVAGSTFIDGNATSIYGSINLNATVHAGPTGLGGNPGSGTAFIDPMITLNPLFNNSLYTLNTGNAVVPSAAGAVPEPAAWALMLGGFGLVGSVARRQRLRTVTA